MALSPVPTPPQPHVVWYVGAPPLAPALKAVALFPLQSTCSSSVFGVSLMIICAGVQAVTSTKLVTVPVPVVAGWPPTEVVVVPVRMSRRLRRCSFWAQPHSVCCGFALVLLLKFVWVISVQMNCSCTVDVGVTVVTDDPPPSKVTVVARSTIGCEYGAITVGSTASRLPMALPAMVCPALPFQKPSVVRIV